MIRWFKTKRALITRTYDLEGIIAKQGEELEILHAEFAEGWNRAVEEQNRLMRQRDDIRRDLGAQIRTQAATIAAQNAHLARVVEELHKLREEIRQAEESGNLPSAAGPGMARPAIRVTRPAPVRGSLASRVQARPLPADLADAIDEETTAKRLADGLGDPR